MKLFILILAFLIEDHKPPRTFVCFKKYEVIRTTYHKFLLIDDKKLVHLGSCKNKTHKNG